MSKCIGCGVILQSKEKGKSGFIPKEKENTKMCERCFRLIHYNDLQEVKSPEMGDFLHVINQSHAMAFFLVDMGNINNEVLNTYKKISIPKCLVLTKTDLFPKSFSYENIRKWLKNVYTIQEEVIFLSALKKRNVHVLFSAMQTRGFKESYLLGYTNAGKSTLLNCLLEEKIVTTSIAPNTTLGFLKHSFANGFFLIDTPGFLYKKPIYGNKEISFLKKLCPKSAMKPITYQLKKGASLLIEDILRLENESEICNITIYMSNLLSIKRVFLNHPALKEAKKVLFSVHKNEDIVVQGLGFMTIKSEANVNIYSLYQNTIEKRKSFWRESK